RTNSIPILPPGTTPLITAIRPTTPNGAESRFMQCCKSSGFSYFRCGGLTDAAHPLFGSIVLVLQMESEWPGFQLARKVENALSTEVRSAAAHQMHVLVRFRRGEWCCRHSRR